MRKKLSFYLVLNLYLWDNFLMGIKNPIKRPVRELCGHLTSQDERGGGCSSMVEPQIGTLSVAGSIPVGHPSSL